MEKEAFYVKVDPERCIACGLCQVKAPQLFDYTNDGIAFYTQDAQKPVPDEWLAQYRQAYAHCPTRAITHRHTATHTSEEDYD